MTGKGTITRAPRRKLRILVFSLVLWLGAICALGAWWGKLVLRQAGKIAELEEASGLAFTEAHAQWMKTQRMLFWESGTYFGLLIASMIVLFALYWRDMKRTRSLQAFFASLTHELRTPLTSIRLQAESIADESTPGALNDAQKHLLERLLEDSQRLELQVDRILELARVEGGGPLFTQPIRVRPWMERMIRDWEARNSDRADVKVEIQDLQIEADSVAMQIILKNLLENSLRHSQQDRVQIEIRTTVEAGNVYLHFKDNGRGFQGNGKYLGKLFEKGENSQGAGVGLYLVQALMKRMGGLAQFSGSNEGFQVALRFRGSTHG
jgi:signal transduction histidine kinase